VNRLQLLLAVLWAAASAAYGQIPVNFTSETIVIDGELTESLWSMDYHSPLAFHQYFPSDSVLAEDQTEIRMAYDDDNLYISVICHSRGDAYTIPTLRRDYRAGGNDNVTLLIDPFSDGANAFMFGVNPAGVQREGLISSGGNTLDGFSTSWDNKWRAETKQYVDKWVAEMAIPFSTLRFNKENTTWRFNCYRFDMQSNERTTMVQIPRNQWIFNLGYMTDMLFERPIAASGSRVSLIPYVAGGVTRDAEAGTDAEYTSSIGGDAKIAITSGLNLDVTINPDFSQVEVDRQVTNLSRFEIFFPERRQFFLENADLFGSFGFSNINPFFSRRVGIATDTTADENNVQNTIYGGLRLSGKLNKDWRIGLLSMQTARETIAAQPGLNYTVAAVQRKVGSRSNIGAIMVNRQSYKASATDAIDRYNRVVGLDYNFANADNSWSGKAFVHRSSSLSSGSDIAQGLRIEHSMPRYLITWIQEYVGADYDAQSGFVRRTDYFFINPRFRYFIPGKGVINRTGIFARTVQIWKPDFGNTDGWIQLGANIEFADNSRLGFELNKRYLYLFDDFDPTGTDSQPLLAETDYHFYFFTADYRSDNRQLLFYRLRPYVGQYFDGYRYGLSGDVNYRVEPYGAIAFNFNVNRFDMNYLEESKSTVLLGPRLDLTFTKEVFLTAFLQYNSQDQNTNINTRLQWRFAPVSDFFLVYSDNYFSGNPGDPSDRFLFRLRDRSIVAKVTYWFNT